MGTTTTELVDPAGEIVGDSVDELVDAYQRCCERLSAERDFADQLRRRLAAMTSGDARTRRVEGVTHVVKLEFPKPNWDSTGMRRLWDEFPSLAQRYMRIERLAPQLREVAKLRETTSDRVDHQEFKRRMLACETESNAPPRVVVEK